MTLKPVRPALAKRSAPDPRQSLRPYITDVHVRNDSISAPAAGRPTIWAVERSNAGASIDDLNDKEIEAQPLDIEVLPALPEPQMPIDADQYMPQDRLPADPYDPVIVQRPPGSVDYTEWPIPAQVSDTEIPHVGDGLAGNRQVALTPFPNLDIQSGPLEKYQLPWWHKVPEDRPFTIPRTMEFQTAPGFVESNGAKDLNWGWYNSFLFSMPFWREKGVGVQASATLEPTTYPQLLSEISFAAFRRAIWAEEPNMRLGLWERLSWGMGFDGIFDTENRIFVGQQRTQLGYALAPNRELGLWFAIPLGSEVATVATNPDVRIGTTAQVDFYYRHVFTSELDSTLFVGVAESPGGFLSGGYVSYRFTAQMSFFLQGMAQFVNMGGSSLYFGMRFYFYPLEDYTLISGNPMNRYRAFMPAPDHINLQLRKTSP